MSVGSDGYWRPDVHAQFLPDDAAVILLMHYTGLVQQTERFAAGADADQPTGWADQYVRLACASKPGLSNFYGSTPTCSSPRADYWEPVTLSTNGASPQPDESCLRLPVSWGAPVGWRP
jgi:hypothetical protein